MITVEDMLRGLGSLVVSRKIKDEWSKNFISNVQAHVTNQSALSSGQSETILKMAGRYIADLHKVMRTDLTSVQQAIAHPQYRRPVYQSISVKREVRYMGTNKLAFRFKADPTVVDDLKRLRNVNSELVPSVPAQFEPQYRLWIVSVTAENLDKIFNIISRHRFEHDMGVLEYLTICKNTKNYKTTIELEPESNVLVANVVNNPMLASLIESLGGKAV